MDSPGGVSPTNAALLLSEAICNAKDNGNKVFAAYIDASKAFDAVWHDSLLNKAYEAGIDGREWQIVNKWYQNLHSKVKWENDLSRSFSEEQGVRQGGILSPSLYKMFINPLLDWYEDDHLGLQIGSIHIGSPTCADDILLLSVNVQDLQVMLNLQEYYANRERYFISENKSKVMIFNQKRSAVVCDELYLNDKNLEIVNEYTRIGINRSHDAKLLVKDKIKLARRTSYAHMH